MLDADVILNSIMSLQKVTLFYWGQNRLLNLVPFILSPITNPGYNLAAHLVFFSFTFFLLLYVMAGIIKRITELPFIVWEKVLNRVHPSEIKWRF